MKRTVSALLRATLVAALVLASHAEASSEKTSAAPGPRFPVLALEDLPMGLGIATVSPRPGDVLCFYAMPGIDESPGDRPPVATVTFGPGQPSVEIAEAPPWPVPEHLKMDYEPFHLRVVTLSREWLEVVGNSRTGETWRYSPLS